MLWPLVGGCWLLESPRTAGTAAQEARRSGAIIVTIPAPQAIMLRL